jgi:hypothetical protein
MMFLHFSNSARKERVQLAIPTNRTVLMAGLSALAILGGCGSHSKSANVGTASTAQLAISASLPAGMEGAGYSGNVTASGGASPYNFAVTSGQMPQGVNMDRGTGNVSGTPTATGNFSFGVTVSDAKGASKEQGLQIIVGQAAAPPPPSPPPASPPPPSTPPPSNPPASNTGGNSFSNVQKAGGWAQYGQGPPDFVDCSPSPCDGISFSMTQGVSSPSLSGQATVFYVGGTTPYSDALWNNHLIGPYSSQGMSDSDSSSFSNFTYDVDFYGDNLGLAEGLEFDINQFFDNMGFIFGHQCRIANGNQWDIWDNSKGKWIPTGIPCHPKSGQWNHLTLKVHRTSDNHQTYESITLNGQTSTLNWTFEKGSSPGWYGLTINFQMDGNYKQDPYKVYLDNLTLTYQ